MVGGEREGGRRKERGRINEKSIEIRMNSLDFGNSTFT